MASEKLKTLTGRLIIDTFPYVMHVLMHDLDLGDLDPKLTKTQLNTLYILHIHGRLNMSALSRHVNRERGSFTSVFDSLERLGFVERHPDRDDRRVVNAGLTTKGKRYMDRARGVVLEHLDRKLECLSASERADFHEAIVTIHRIAEKISEEKR